MVLAFFTVTSSGRAVGHHAPATVTARNRPSCANSSGAPEDALAVAAMTLGWIEMPTCRPG
jgi:hypothetical protein